MGNSPVAEQVGIRLRELRAARNLSIRTLATTAGFSASFVSQVERGQASPSLDSLDRIASALDITLADFFVSDDATQPDVVPQYMRPKLSSAWSRARIEALSPIAAGRQLEAVIVTFEAGGRSGGEPHAHPRDEFALVFAGEVELTLGSVKHSLVRGDAVTIAAGAPHGWANLSNEPAQVVMVARRFAPESLVLEG